MEYSPPPLFKQGASARAKVVFFSLLALILLAADSRVRSLATVRQAIGTALYPLQVVALMPRDAMYVVADYFSSLTSLQRENRDLKQRNIANAQTLQQVQQLEAENAQLRRLLDATERLPAKSVMSEILYDARDAFTRKIVLDRGSQHGVEPGQPVIDDAGVVGQVTRVFPFTSEVTLLTDKDQAIPVQVVRSGLRSIAYGQGHIGQLDLRFMPANADIQNGDILVTSGIDGVYPAGLAVASVVQVETKSSAAFARIICQPLAGIGRNRQLLILLTESKFPPRPPAEDAGKDKTGKKRVTDVAKEPAKDAPPQPAKADAKVPNTAAASAVPAAPAAAPAPAPSKAPAKAPVPVAPAPTRIPAATPAPAAAAPNKAPATAPAPVAPPTTRAPATVPVPVAPVTTPAPAEPVQKKVPAP